MDRTLISPFVSDPAVISDIRVGATAISEVRTGAASKVSPSQHSAWFTPYIGQPDLMQAAWPWM